MIKRKSVLIIGIDGCRADCLSSSASPTIYQLLETGAYSLNYQVNDRCLSGPGWSTLATGVWRNKHGVEDNSFTIQRFDKYPTFMTRIKQLKPETRTASIVHWLPLKTNIFNKSIDHSYAYEGNDQRVVDQTIHLLTEEERLDVVFVHLDDVDHSGHAYDYGPHIPQYLDALKRVDQQICDMIVALRLKRRWYENEDWLILLTTDHGGLDRDHEINIPENRTTFLIMNGTSVQQCGEIHPHPLIVDLSPTILLHLNIPIDLNWQLDGRPLNIKYSLRSWINLEVELK